MHFLSCAYQFSSSACPLVSELFRFRSVLICAVPMLFQSIPSLHGEVQFSFFSVRYISGSCRFPSMRCHSTASRCCSVPPLRASKHFLCCASPCFSSANRSVAKLFRRFSLLRKSVAFRFATGLCNSSAFRANSLRILRLYILCISYSLQIAATPAQVSSPHFPLGAMQFRFNSLRRLAIPLQFSALLFRRAASRPMQFRSMVRSVQNRSPGVTPRMSEIRRILNAVGSEMPRSQFETALWSTPRASASSFWVIPRLSRYSRIFSAIRNASFLTKNDFCSYFMFDKSPGLL